MNKHEWLPCSLDGYDSRYSVCVKCGKNTYSNTMDSLCEPMKKSKKIEIDLPEEPPAGSFSCCPSGDTEYEEALILWRQKVNKAILEAIPLGFNLKSSDVKKTTVVRHFATIVVEEA